MNCAPVLPRVMHESPSLSAEQIEQIQEELLRTLTRLERSMKISGQAARPVELDQSCVGRLSRIDAIQNQGLMQNLQEREKVQLAQVLAALRRIEEGRYGICGGCGKPIQPERLMVFPETRTCTPCSRACGA